MSFYQELREHLKELRDDKALNLPSTVRADRMHDAVIQSGYIQALEDIDEWVVDYLKRQNEGA